MPRLFDVLDLVRPQPQDDWIVFGSGFLQHMGNDQGVPRMAAAFENRYKDRNVRVDLRLWDSDWDDLAEWIFRRCSDPANVNLMCIIYSWGAGFGFNRFSRSCRDRGIRISGAVICDGVAHLGGRLCHNIGLSQVAAYWPPPCFERMPSWLKWTKLDDLGRLKLWLPDNIDKENTHWYIQQNSWLRGHDIFWEDTGLMAENRNVVPMRTHSYMDEAPEFKRKAIEIADKLFTDPPALAA